MQRESAYLSIAAIIFDFSAAGCGLLLPNWARGPEGADELTWERRLVSLLEALCALGPTGVTEARGLSLEGPVGRGVAAEDVW